MLRKIKTGLLMIAIITMTGCSEEFLENKPTNAISEADALSNVENLKLVLNGLHRQMYAQSPIPGGSDRTAGEHYWIPLQDVLVGGVIHSAPANGWMRSDLQWLAHTIPTSLTVEQLWYQRYHFIASASAIINTIEESGFVVDDEVSNILGQAHAYRAWAYYSLVNTYAKGYLVGNPNSDLAVPLLTGTVAPYESGPRVTVQKIYDQINADIDQAIVYFADGVTTPADKSQLSINAAYGIKARVALQSGDWTAASSAAVLARDGVPLMSEADWKSGFNSVDLPEVIWGGVVIDSETTFFRSYFYLIAPTFNGSQNRGNPKLFNQEIYNQIPATDYRISQALPLAPNTNGSANNDQGGSFESDPNYDNKADFDAAHVDVITTYGMTGRHNTHPYMHVKFLSANPGTIDPDDVIYMRSSEMYLIEAEALTMMNDVSGAQAALAALGGARDTAYDENVFNNKTSLMNQIEFQRYVELYGEGFGWTNHLRWDKPLDLTNSGADPNYYGDGFTQAAPSVNNNWIWKIPQAEIDANPFINESDQN